MEVQGDGFTMTKTGYQAKPDGLYFDGKLVYPVKKYNILDDKLSMSLITLAMFLVGFKLGIHRVFRR